MSDVPFTHRARYLLQIDSNGKWKTVAYLNDREEATRTMEKVPALRVVDAWSNNVVQLHDRPKMPRDRDLIGRRLTGFAQNRIRTDYGKLS